MTQKNLDLYIIAAGKGSRLGGSIPKALVPLINDEPNITTILKTIGRKFDHVFIVVNVDIESVWREYLQTLIPELGKNVHLVPIKSGLGDGHATMCAFAATTPSPYHDKEDSQNALRISTASNVMVCWGDLYIPDGAIVDEMMGQFAANDFAVSGILPAIFEQNPYVALTTAKMMQCTGASFSKWGELESEGYHDQSIFLFKKESVWAALGTAYDVYWKNGKFTTPGNELSLLHTFNILYNQMEPCIVYETEYPTMSFNTVEELMHIKKELKHD